jgi:hypothetical protein
MYAFISYLNVSSFLEIIGVLHEVVKTQPLAAGKKPCTNLVLANERYISNYYLGLFNFSPYF